MTPSNFLDLPPEAAEYGPAAYAVLPAAYDGTSTWKKGADRGPDAIIEASSQVELYDIETVGQAWKRGIHTLPPLERFASPEECVTSVQTAAAGIFSDRKVPVILGGEHTVAVGGAWAAADFFQDLTVLQLDAHGDLRESYEGSRFNHACVMARVRERVPVIQAGIRSISPEEAEKIDRDRTFFARDIHAEPQKWIEGLLPLLTPRVYITLDLDVFDPAYVPSTGTPEPGGLDWYQVTGLLRAVAARSRIVGFDVTELCPGGHHASEFLAAKLIYKIMNYREEYTNGKA